MDPRNTSAAQTDVGMSRGRGGRESEPRCPSSVRATLVEALQVPSSRYVGVIALAPRTRYVILPFHLIPPYLTYASQPQSGVRGEGNGTRTLLLPPLLIATLSGFTEQYIKL